MAGGNLEMLEFNEEQTLPRVDVPVLVIVGEHDRMTLPSAGERIEQLLPRGAIASVAGGHLSLRERHSDVVDLIAEFAGRLAPRTPISPYLPARKQNRRRHARSAAQTARLRIIVMLAQAGRG